MGGKRSGWSVEQIVKSIFALVRSNLTLDHVDAITVTLRQGVNIGIYSSYETATRHEPVKPENEKH